VNKTFNRVTLLGFAGYDPELKYSKSHGRAYTRVSIATKYSRLNKETGEWEDLTNWIEIMIFGRKAEVAAEYLRKGDLVYFDAEVRRKVWKNSGGDKRYETVIVAEHMIVLGKFPPAGRRPMKDPLNKQALMGAPKLPPVSDEGDYVEAGHYDPEEI
jgi:single stranded DNA-binding protein